MKIKAPQYEIDALSEAQQQLQAALLRHRQTEAALSVANDKFRAIAELIIRTHKLDPGKYSQIQIDGEHLVLTPVPEPEPPKLPSKKPRRR